LLVDIDDDLTCFKRHSLSFEQLPLSYLPKENIYFMLKNCPDMLTIQRYIQSVPQKSRLKELAQFA
jgi:hypothetical protein